MRTRSAISVHAMFEKFQRSGGMRTAYLKSTPTPQLSYSSHANTRYGQGFVDYHGPRSDIANSAPMRMISGVALREKKKTEVIFEVRILPDEQPGPTIVIAALFSRSINMFQMPVHESKNEISGLHITFPAKMVSSAAYLEILTPEEIFTSLANKDDQFLALVRRFNSLVS